VADKALIWVFLMGFVGGFVIGVLLGTYALMLVEASR